ncbi:MAG: DUF11 domain-containing protein [Bacteroidales bacterium]|nr:DUF11 domain-containing protein [Bacteroidales bacterium]
MSKLLKRILAGFVMVAAAGGAAIAVSPPLELQLAAPTAKIPPADSEKACCATAKPGPDDCCQNGVCHTDCCKSGCCKTNSAPALGVALEWSGPLTARVNKPSEYTLTARNVSNRPVQQVTVQIKVPAGIDVTATMPQAKRVDSVFLWDLGTLAVGESAPVTVTMATARRGDIGCEAWVTCTGTAAMTVAVKEPKLEVAVASPKRVVIGSKYAVEYTVTNVGDVAVDSIQCSRESGDIPAVPGMMIPSLAPGESRAFSAEFRASNAGSQTHMLTAVTTDGLYASTSAQTLVEGVPALRMEVVDLADPVEKGGETTYEIRVLNTGTAPDSNVTVTCPLPGQLKLEATTGPTTATVQHLNTLTLVRFDPIRELAPKTEAVFRVKVRAIGSGDVRFTTQMTSANLTTSVTKEESTRVYGE